MMPAEARKRKSRGIRRFYKAGVFVSDTLLALILPELDALTGEAVFLFCSWSVRHR